MSGGVLDYGDRNVQSCTMNAVPFDTLKMAQRLGAAGFAAPQAAGMAEALALADAMAGSDLATKDDIAALRTELKGDIAGLDQRMTSLRAEQKGDNELLRRDMEIMLRDIEVARRDVVIKIGSMMVIAVGVMLTAIRMMTLHL